MGIKLAAASGGSVELVPTNTASNFVATMPAVTGNVVLDSATQTLTNKTIQGGAITSGTAVASTSGTSIDFTSIPSWVKRITVMFNGVSTSGTSAFRLQLGTSSGIATSGYSSVCAQIGTGFTVGSSSGGFDSAGDNGAGFTRFGALTFSFLGSNTWELSGSYNIYSQTYIYVFSGGTTLSGTLDRLRITTVNGTDTFDAGSINILYE